MLPWLRDLVSAPVSESENSRTKLTKVNTDPTVNHLNDANHTNQANQDQHASYDSPDDVGTPIHKLSWHDEIPIEWLDGAFVVIVRYLTNKWKKTLALHRGQLHSLAYFFDDDILDVRAAQGLPLKYRFKLYRYGARNFDWLIRQDVKLFVSTPYLQKKYGDYGPQLLTPKQLSTYSDQTKDPTKQQPGYAVASAYKEPLKKEKRYRVFYHATASHRKEIEWLYPVMKEVLASSPNIEFEIVGDARTRSLYKNLPRTTIINPMSWEAYQQFIAQPGRDIGLAPHLDSPFNRARSYTKLFDIERAGAIAVLADNGPWAELGVRESLESMLGTNNLRKHVVVPMDTKLWVTGIMRTADIPTTPAANEQLCTNLNPPHSNY